MRKLNRIETREALQAASNIDPLDFQEELAKYLPGNMLDYLIDANLDAAIKRWPMVGIDMQRQIASFGMSGFQLGWLLAKEVLFERGSVM